MIPQQIHGIHDLNLIHGIDKLYYAIGRPTDVGQGHRIGITAVLQTFTVQGSTMITTVHRRTVGMRAAGTTTGEHCVLVSFGSLIVYCGSLFMRCCLSQVCG